MITLILKYKQMNIKKPVLIYDTAGHIKFELRAAFSGKGLFSKTVYHLVDYEGRILLSFPPEGTWSIPLRCSIAKDDVAVGDIFGCKKPFRPTEFQMSYNGEKYALRATKRGFLLIEVEFLIQKSDFHIATITKKWHQSTYHIVIQEEREAIPVVCLASILSHFLNIRQR